MDSTRLQWLLARLPWVAGGAAIAFVFDPKRGRRRRRLARKRSIRYTKAVGRRAKRVVPRGKPTAAEQASDAPAAGRSGAASAEPAAAAQPSQTAQPDDVTLARKVETEIFRDKDVPKGHINVNAEAGVVFLRGRVNSEDQIAELEREVREIPGVRGVENRLETGTLA